MRSQPRSEGRIRAFGQQFNHLVPFEINQNRAKAAPTPKRPLVHAEDPGCCGCGSGRLAEQAEQGPRTGGHAEAIEQAGASLTTEGKAHHAEDIREADGFPRIGGDNAREPLSEDAA
jgi:hypothetical protein